MNAYSVKWRRIGSILLAALAVGTAAASGNIDPTNKHAWAENTGWVNFAPTDGGVTVVLGDAGGFLSGYAWAENIGWIKLGNTNGGPYLNTSATDWGVNVADSGALEGYAWSENGGWINFHPSGSQVTIDRQTGSFDGYAWGENLGWIHVRGTNEPVSPSYYNVQTTAIFARGTVFTLR